MNDADLTQYREDVLRTLTILSAEQEHIKQEITGIKARQVAIVQDIREINKVLNVGRGYVLAGVSALTIIGAIIGILFEKLFK